MKKKINQFVEWLTPYVHKLKERLNKEMLQEILLQLVLILIFIYI